MSASAAAPVARPLLPFAAFSASYFAHIGFFNPYLSLWLKELGIGLLAIGLPGVLAGLFGGLLSSRLGLPSVFWACMVTALGAAACALRALQLDRDPAVSPPRSPATG